MQQNMELGQKQREQRNRKRAQELLVTRMQSDPDFAKNLAQGQGLALISQIDPSFPAKIAVDQFNANNQLQRDQARFMAQEKLKAQLAKKYPASVSSQIVAGLADLDEESQRKSLRLMGVDENLINQNVGIKKLPKPEKPAAQVVSFNGVDYIQQPNGNLTPVPVRQERAPQYTTITSLDENGNTISETVPTEEAVRRGPRITGMPKPVKDDKPEDFSKNEKDIGTNLISADISKALSTRTIAESDGRGLEELISKEPDPNRKKLLLNIKGIGTMYSYMQTRDNSVVKPTELALIKSALPNFNGDQNIIHGWFNEVSKYINGQSTQISPDAMKVMDAFRTASLDGLQATVLDNLAETLKEMKVENPNLNISNIMGHTRSNAFLFKLGGFRQNWIRAIEDEAAAERAAKMGNMPETSSSPDAVSVPALGGSLGNIPVDPNRQGLASGTTVPKSQIIPQGFFKPEDF
jgi:hypothetical protein